MLNQAAFGAPSPSIRLESIAQWFLPIAYLRLAELYTADGNRRKRPSTTESSLRVLVRSSTIVTVGPVDFGTPFDGGIG